MGIAQTVINWKDYGVEGQNNEDLFFEIILSTNQPEKEVSIDWHVQGRGYLKQMILNSRDAVPDEDGELITSDGGHISVDGRFIVFFVLTDDDENIPTLPTFKEFKRLIMQSGVLDVAKNFKERIFRLKKENPKINPAKISDNLLVTSLNVLSRFEGKKLTWTKRKIVGKSGQ